MTKAYVFAAGPLLWVSVIVFAAGCLLRLGRLAWLARKKDRPVYAYMSAHYALRSIGRWLVPMGTESMRKHPVTTVVSFAFHAAVVLVPLFLFAHVLLFYEAFGISWWTLPEEAAYAGTLVVLAGLVYFFARRLIRPEVRYLSGPADFALLVLVALPFATGLWAFHHGPGVRVVMLLHVLSGEALLAAIPFTKLSHMFLFPFLRGYMGSEFGSVRHARDW
ncbi:MAG: respiratory nitrate reductase subunit gamma [Deltaproteobacteria bacterium]|nr:respiratory nitrate reductase subunit gamma [Deltaproteobacteria bacterium]